MHRIVTAVGKHVIPEDTLAGGNECVCIDESADGGIVVTALQIIESGISDGRLARRPFFAPSPLVFKTENQGFLCGCSEGVAVSISTLNIAAKSTDG